MGKIVILDELTANQIAAGEVVEGPSSVVKEMVENAVDAGATAVQVEIRNGGIRSIRVTDNGSGMERDDVELAFERHATSKIRRIGDLDSIRSMGFRGEALASIASVSRLEMLTRTAEETTGLRVTMEGGTLASVEPAGCPAGTTFHVRDLFYNTPARYKFLKKDTTEAARVSDVMERLALAHPGVSLQLKTNGEPVLHTPGNGDLASTIYSLYGKETAGALLPLDGTHEGIRVSGFVGRPTIARGNRARQTLLMNGRVIRNSSVTAALDEAYKTLLMTRQFAFAVIVLEVPPLRVDVNVHPAKLEVRFSEEGVIFSAVHGAVKSALMVGAQSGSLAPLQSLGTKERVADLASDGRSGHAVAEPASDSRTGHAMTDGAFEGADRALNTGAQPRPFVVSAPLPALSEQQRFVPASASLPSVPSLNAQAGTRDVSAGSNESAARNAPTDFAELGIRAERTDPSGAWLHPGQTLVADVGTGVMEESPEAALSPNRNGPSGCTETGEAVFVQALTDAQDNGPERPGLRHPVFLEMRIVGQVFASFIVLEHGEEMLLLDQHAAHERIRFEDLKEGLEHGKATSQPFLAPVPISLSTLEYDTALRSLDMLNRIGFEVEPFGRNALLVRAIPATFDGGLSESELSSILTDWPAEQGRRQGVVSDEALHRISCKGAIKANHSLSGVEIRALLERLSRLDNPYTCVHGRPILLRFPRRELEKRFKRIV